MSTSFSSKKFLLPLLFSSLLLFSLPVLAENEPVQSLDRDREAAALEALREARDTLARQRGEEAETDEGDEEFAEGSEQYGASEEESVSADEPEEYEELAKEERAQEELTTQVESAPREQTAQESISAPRGAIGLAGEPTIEELDARRLARFQAFVDRFQDEDQGALMRIREVGGRLIGAPQGYLALQPYVPDPRWNEAMSLLADGKCDDAMKKATEVLGPPSQHRDGEPAIRYAFARIQLCNGEATRGRETLRELSTLQGPVADLSRRALGARVVVATDDESVHLSTLINRSRSRASQGDVDGALQELVELRDSLSSNVERHQVRLAEARIMEDDRRLDDAAQAYLGVYRMTRWWRSSDRVVAQIAEAERRMDREIIPFGDRVDRMTELIERGRYRQAHEVSRENVRIRNVSGNEVRGWTRFRQALENERDRNRTLAVRQFEEADSLIKDPEVRPRLYYGWARALRRTGGDSEAIELYQRLCEEYPKNHLCAQALFEAGRLLQYRNNHDEARKHFAQLVGLYPFSPYVPDALWLFALSAYHAEDYAAAIPPLKMLVEYHGHLQDESELTVGLKARYWVGMNYLRLGEEVEAQKWLQETIDSGALTWYGRLAAIRLEDAGLSARVRLPTARLTREDIEDFATLRLPQSHRLSLAAELARIGIFSEALSEVRSQLGVHPAPEGGVQLRAALHLAMDEPNWAHWIMKSVIDERGPTHRTLRDWGFAFPMNYIDLAHQWGDQYGVSPFLVQAIIRQESGFRPTVRSHAGAMGLMQLMPATARYTSRQFLEQRTLTENQILDVVTNVRLGTMYIRIHIAHAADQPALALAGYNAGPGALRSWFERYGDREIDAFVESITYAETRGYVRKVMTSFITYQGLYGDGTLPHIDLKLPERLRSWGELPEVREDEPISMIW